MMDYDDLDDDGKALADAYEALEDPALKAVVKGLYQVHTNDVGPDGPPPKPPVKQ